MRFPMGGWSNSLSTGQMLIIGREPTSPFASALYGGRRLRLLTRVRLMQTKAKADGTGFVYLAAAISALGGMLFGYDIGVISGAILFIKKDFALSSGMEEIVVSSVLLGSLAGAAAGGVLADRLGRRKLLIFTA